MSKALQKFTDTDKQDFSAMIGDAIDVLESFQVPHPYPAIESVLAHLYQMRDRLRMVTRP